MNSEILWGLLIALYVVPFGVWQASAHASLETRKKLYPSHAEKALGERRFDSLSLLWCAGLLIIIAGWAVGWHPITATVVLVAIASVVFAIRFVMRRWNRPSKSVGRSRSLVKTPGQAWSAPARLSVLVAATSFVMLGSASIFSIYRASASQNAVTVWYRNMNTAISECEADRTSTYCESITSWRDNFNESVDERDMWSGLANVFAIASIATPIVVAFVFFSTRWVRTGTFRSGTDG
jgi:hypothetical protein